MLAVCITTFYKNDKIHNLLKSLHPKKNENSNLYTIIHIDNNKDNYDEFINDELVEKYNDYSIVLTSDEKIGVSASRNKIIEYISTNLPNIKYIKLSDDDDESIPIDEYYNILKIYNSSLTNIMVIEGTSTLKRRNNNCNTNNIVNICCENDYLLSNDYSTLYSIGKFSRGVIWTLILHIDILKQIPFIKLTSYEDTMFRYMLYEYCRIYKLKYIYIPDIMYIYYGSSGTANDYSIKISAESLSTYDSIYKAWTNKSLNYIQLLKFTFPFIHGIPYVDETGNINKCKTINDLHNSVIDFNSFKPFISTQSKQQFSNINNKITNALRVIDISELDIYYMYITQYIAKRKEYRYINNIYTANNNYNNITVNNIMKKYPVKNNNRNMNILNKFISLNNDKVTKSILINDDYDYYIKYSMYGTIDEDILSNEILLTLFTNNNNICISNNMEIIKNI